MTQISFCKSTKRITSCLVFSGLIIGTVTIAGCGNKANNSTGPATDEQMATAIDIIQKDRLATPEQKAQRIKKLKDAQQKAISGG